METVVIPEEVVEVDENVRDVEVVAQSSTVELVTEAARCANLGAVAIVCAGCPMLQFCQKPESGAPKTIPTETSGEVSHRSLPEQEKKPEPSYLEQLLDDSVNVVLARSLETQSDAQSHLAESLVAPESESGGGDATTVETKHVEISQTVQEPEVSSSSDEQAKDSNEVSEETIIYSSEIVHEIEYIHQTLTVAAKSTPTIVAVPSQETIHTETAFAAVVSSASRGKDMIVDAVPVSSAIEAAQPESANECIMTEIPLANSAEIMEPIFLAPRIEVVTASPYVFELPSDGEIVARTKDKTASFKEHVVTPTESPSIDDVEGTPLRVASEYTDPDRLLEQLVSFETDEVLVLEEGSDGPVVIFQPVEHSLDIVENLDKTALRPSQTEVRPVDVGVCGSTAILEPTGIVPETDVVYEAIIRSNDVLDPELRVSNSPVQVIHQHTIGVLRQLLAMQALGMLLVKLRSVNRLS